MECCNLIKITFLKRKKILAQPVIFFMLYWDQCTKPIKWFPSFSMVTLLPFLMLQNYPNFWFYPYNNGSLFVAKASYALD